MFRFIFFTIVSFFFYSGHAQTCTNPGQTPQTAFPVCGTTTFTQNSVPLCGNRNIVGPCGSAGLTDKNPYWYKFTCYSAGTLGFIINPLAANEDYDWQLFNVSGVTNLNDVYTNASLFVTCSWSGTFGNTGATAAGTVNYACDGSTPVYTKMPNLVVGNEYILMISHFTNGQSGYNLSFTGGTASITDPLQPKADSATASCDGIHINIKLNKRLRCNSLAANGSDFTINTTATNIIAATGFGCSAGFDMDSLQLTLQNPLPPGNYTIKIKNGNDVNTLLDLCGTQIPINDSLKLVVPVQTPVPMDSIKVAACSPQEVVLTFSNPIRCSSIEPNGSDFVITGPSAVSILQAVGSCGGNGLTQEIKLSLAAPIKLGGQYTILLRNGSDGNTLLNDCSQSTPVGSSLFFTVRDSVAASFTQTIHYDPCSSTDTVRFTHPGFNGVNQWSWTFNGGNPSTATIQNPLVTYANPGTYTATLKVSNAYCTDSISIPVTINSVVKDVVSPKMATAVASCDGTQMVVKLNKKIQCSSIAADGSDFVTRPALANVISAVSTDCGANAETDSILIRFASPLPTGAYTLVMVNGADGNTLIDRCNRSIPANDSVVNIAVVQHFVIALDSIGKVGCKPQELVLVFKEPIRCSSVAPNGSDFRITGPATVGINQATTICDANGFTSSVKLTLATAIVNGGTYQVQLQLGSDGNTLLNACNTASRVGGGRSFVVKDTVSTLFTYAIGYSCISADTISFFHAGGGGITQWTWKLGNGTTSILQNPIAYYNSTGNVPVTVTVSNGSCTDSTTRQIFIDTDSLTTSFEAPSLLCPAELVVIKNNSRGKIASYEWDFGNGTNSILANPPSYVYPTPLSETLYRVKLTLTGTLGCKADTTVIVKALNNCVIAVPTGFTPNGDGLNDYLYPINAFRAENLLFRVYNRFGQLIFESRSMNQKWNGTINGVPQQAGTYIWILHYTDTDTKKIIDKKGTTVLIR